MHAITHPTIHAKFQATPLLTPLARPTPAPCRPRCRSTGGRLAGRLSAHLAAHPGEPPGDLPRRQGPLGLAARRAAALGWRAWLRLYHRLRIVGRENLPAEGPFVLIANHASHLDVLCLLAALPARQLPRAFPVAAAEYFFAPAPGGPPALVPPAQSRRPAGAAAASALAVWAVNALPLARRHAGHGLHRCRHLLARGNVLILFPEGTRSTTGRLGPFKPGVGALLAGTRVPAVPCALHGTALALPKGQWFPRPVPLRLTIGRPRTYAAAPDDKQGAVSVSEDLRRAVEELSGPV